MNQEFHYLSTDDVAYALGITRPTVIKYIKENRLDAVRSGKAYKITPESLINFANKQGITENPIKVLTMRHEKNKKTVLFEQVTNVQSQNNNILTQPDILPIRENQDALYYLSIWMNDAHNELVFRVRESFLIIGRDSLANLSIQDPYVSSVHAVLTYQEEFVLLRDQSTNGTFADGRHLKYGETVNMGDGSEFVVGNTRLKLLSPHQMDEHFNHDQEGREHVT
ncbi:MAG: FHA domain-containing protein [Desulfobacterales bacterium]|nr:FHA domain-containing protein [Desulfobacterales bacterium]